MHALGDLGKVRGIASTDSFVSLSFPMLHITRIHSIAQAIRIRQLKFKVFRHPHLIADGGVLIHTSVAFVNERSAVWHAVGVRASLRAHLRGVPFLLVVFE